MIDLQICSELLELFSLGIAHGFALISVLELLSYGINWALSLVNINKY